jgi:hypothetical protein
VAFDWMRFLESNHVHFVTGGSNVSRGHVAVKCPLCGNDDPSEHMSINLNSGGWRCFRRPEAHKGGSPVRLVAALLGISQAAAGAIVGENVHIPDDVLGTVRGLFAPKAAAIRAPLSIPPEFKPFRGQRSARRFEEYLAGPTRQFTDRQIATLTDRYGLHYATSGKFRGRIIFPVTYNGDIVSYTGRSIYPDQDLRYLTLSTDEEKDDPPAWGPINDYLLFYDQLMTNKWDCDTLICCEGPFDALKVSVLGRPYGIDATCFFTAAPTQGQIYMLNDLVPVYRKRFLMLDQGTIATALRTQFDMQSMSIGVLTLPKSLKDPGLITEKQLLKIVP